ncbi:MAG: hypothetical protein QME40_04155 [bacterium]|nr:hypothetical protein [bacterium]
MVEKVEKLANPAPLGLNAGLFSLSTMILAMGIFYGGLAQIIAGIFVSCSLYFCLKNSTSSIVESVGNPNR